MINKGFLSKFVFYTSLSSLLIFIGTLCLYKDIYFALSIGLVYTVLEILKFFYFEELWIKVTGFRAKPAVIWMTGLSGSGKTTIAKNLMNKLKRLGVSPIMLDGDEIRGIIRIDGFDEESRKKHNLNVGYLASLFENDGHIVIVSLISPYDDVRLEISKMCKNFVEVYIATSLEICLERDPKGLYQKAIKGEIKEFTGISSPYFPPKSPKVTLDTSVLNITECVNRIYKIIKN